MVTAEADDTFVSNEKAPSHWSPPCAKRPLVRCCDDCCHMSAVRPRSVDNGRHCNCLHRLHAGQALPALPPFVPARDPAQRPAGRPSVKGGREYKHFELAGCFLPLDVDPVPMRSKETGGAGCRVTVTFPMCGIGGGNWRSNVVGVCNRCTQPGGKRTFCLFLFSTGNFFFTLTPPTD